VFEFVANADYPIWMSRLYVASSRNCTVVEQPGRPLFPSP